jgi:hypothetical protein
MLLALSSRDIRSRHAATSLGKNGDFIIGRWWMMAIWVIGPNHPPPISLITGAALYSPKIL